MGILQPPERHFGRLCLKAILQKYLYWLSTLKHKGWTFSSTIELFLFICLKRCYYSVSINPLQCISRLVLKIIS